MKKIILFILLALVTSSAFSQKWKRMIDMSEYAPIVSYTNRLHVLKGADTLTVHSLGVGISLANGDIDNSGFPIASTWEYLALPYVKLDFNFANSKGKGELFNPKDGGSPIMLSAGVTGGKGVAFIFLPLGINATAGLATDFKDGYLQYGLAYDAVGISIGISGMFNFTNSNNSFYKSEMGLELRYIWGWD